MSSDHFANHHKWVPIERTEGKFLVFKNKSSSPVINYTNTVLFTVVIWLYCTQGASESG